jgi:hypothetical protein
VFRPLNILFPKINVFRLLNILLPKINVSNIKYSVS